MAVVVTGLEIFGDVGKRRQILRILSRTGDVSNLVFRYDVLQRQEGRSREEEKREERDGDSKIKRCRWGLLIISSEALHGKTNLIYYASHCTHPKTIITVEQFGFERVLWSPRV